MSSLSQVPQRGRRRPWWGGALLGLGLAMAVLCLWVLGSLESQGALWSGLLAVLAMLLLCVSLALGWHLGVRLTRQQLGESLRELRQQLHAQAQVQSDWQWQTDAQHHLIRWQAPWGQPGSSWVGPAATQSLAERLHLEGTPTAQLQEVLAAQRPVQQLCLPGASACAKPQAGSWALQAVPLLDGSGRFCGFLGSARFMAAPEVVAPAQAALSPLQQTDGDTLRAEQAAFAYTVSHDLRAPLRVVEGFARILREDYGRLLDRVGNDHLDRISGAAQRMNQMIDALLALSRLSVQALECRPVDLSVLAGLVVEELRRDAPQRKVEVRIQPGLVAQGDPTLLRVVLENLLGNAWKYSGKCELAHIAFECKDTSQGRVFMVSDDGAGFDMRFADRLFAAFQRLHSASDFPGTGVGLASVQRIIRRHGGDIWAESAVGQGARFNFTLPG
ncbi:ATP-binding protein [Mitsuaria sp. WAJ17]|uniref:sensor histidine kinase n=1 Tax=Mitsuaria sp. WAJ17 TaxID=2761452 RepID=UPI001C80F1E5|nr:ATP-binding protein [Mitsuaria sp. WAJ17]